MKNSKAVTKTLSLDGLTLFPVSCRVVNGEVRPAKGAVYVSEGVEGATFAAYSRSLDLYLLFDGNYVHISYDNKKFTPFLPVASPIAVFSVREKDAPAAAIVMSSLVTFLTEKGAEAVLFDEEISDAVLHCGRAFAISEDGYTLYWSKSGLDDWTQELNGGGNLKLDYKKGRALDILEFGERLVAMREFGLSVFSMYGNAENFAVKLIDADTDEVVKGTAKVVCGKLYFCTKSGLWVFDGSRASRVSHRFEGELVTPLFAESFSDGYYLSCTTANFGKVILCYEPDVGDSYIIDAEADFMCVSDGLYIYNGDGVYELCEGAEFSLIADGVDFGTGDNKTVTEIYADTESCNAEISDGSFTRSFENACVFRPSLRGRRFMLKLAGREKIKGIYITAEVSIGI